ncbi:MULTISPECIES: ABC transporter ATP-binding protein [Salipiger]|uniref:Amino acid/amide ABC transporter ATP-binding protein 2, HAAT family n=1 Tax=Salipiger profundus TaxID=1229727 RepID=A0A1U7DDN3_9RHOB|nr:MULTISPECIES: ABC transporter ATP-binding protein [Salipiger]APX26170.1 amino acid/amide ABC transporter ATP-binding protein 2, HAAT family [Salipiger profundus]GGA23572.1 ABC transporter ATP-binding protein [Salipiger profundus]
MLDAASEPLLRVSNLQGHYGDSHVLHGMNFEVREGELVTLLGRNGAGKTTTMRALMGLLNKRTGSITFQGRETISLLPEAIGRLGLAICPEERGIFASLSVAENLELPPVLRPGGLTLAEVHDIFPRLKERARSRGNQLSGGEQQMLAIARILRTGAKFLLLDEPTEGLAPVIVEQIGAVITDLKRRGFTILLVEQNFHFAATIADRHYVVEDGTVVDMIPNDQIEANAGRLATFLGV